ncbi:MAG: hypothetical protein HYV52_00905 [Parcubacteria group bacterium]|nr:hypothetical protein [Parcubacteria group bacterium]
MKLKVCPNSLLTVKKAIEEKYDITITEHHSIKNRQKYCRVFFKDWGIAKLVTSHLGWAIHPVYLDCAVLAVDLDVSETIRKLDDFFEDDLEIEWED